MQAIYRQLRFFSTRPRQAGCSRTIQGLNSELNDWLQGSIRSRDVAVREDTQRLWAELGFVPFPRFPSLTMPTAHSAENVERNVAAPGSNSCSMHRKDPSQGLHRKSVHCAHRPRNSMHCLFPWERPNSMPSGSAGRPSSLPRASSPAQVRPENSWSTNESARKPGFASTIR